MNTVMFIILHQYRNRIKSIFSRPLSAIFTVLACICFFGSLVVTFIAKKTGVSDSSLLEVIIACLPLIIGVFLINSFLSQQNGIFTLPDANFLFSAPLERKTVLAYALIQTGPASLITALFMTFYIPFIVGSSMTPLRFIFTLLIMTLLFGCIYLFYYYIYIQDIGHPGLKRRLRNILWATILVFVAIFLTLLIINGFDISKTSGDFFKSPFYDALPVFGWSKLAIISVIKGNLLFSFVSVLLLMLFIILFARLLYSNKVDFYEQALQDSIRVQELMDKVKSGNLDRNSFIAKKVKNVNINFRQGAAAILSRQVLELKKSKSLISYRDFLTGIIYIIVGKVAGLDFNFVFIMLIFSLLSTSLANSWNADFKKPYVYLIPENSILKVIYSVIPGLLKSILSGTVSMIIASVAYGIPLNAAIANTFILISYVFVFTFSSVFSYRVLGNQSGAVALMFLRMLFLIIASIPGTAFVLIYTLLSKSAIAITAFTLGTILVNMLESFLLAFLSRRIYEQSELMN